ncbi:hypothetical protein CR513_52332, partial [Mucuna pruriens]
MRKSQSSWETLPKHIMNSYWHWTRKIDNKVRRGKNSQVSSTSARTKALKNQKFKDFRQGQKPKPKPSLDEAPQLDLKTLPSNLKHAFLKPHTSLPVITFTTLTRLMEDRLIRVLRNNKEAFRWTIHNIKSINPTICTHRIYMEDEYEPRALPQYRLNLNMKEVVKGEVLKLLDVGIIYLISNSKWVSLVHCVPKKGGTK